MEPLRKAIFRNFNQVRLCSGKRLAVQRQTFR